MRIQLSVFHPIVVLLFLGQLLVADADPFESKPTDKLTVTSSDQSASLSVTLERINIDKTRKVMDPDDKDIIKELWLGDRKLPLGVIYYGATLVSSFDLKIDGKPVKVPARFWNDIAGLSLSNVIINTPVKTEDDEWRLQEFIQQLRRPHVVRSADGETVLITWIRPEE